jgi:hypothetical protein
MNSKYPELALERVLKALERDVLDATDEEFLMAAHELGMNPSMKGSAAFFGVTLPASFRTSPREADEQGNASGVPHRIEATRQQVYSWLAALTPREAKALRARFGVDEVRRNSDEEEVMLHALARELTLLQKKQ